MKYLALLFLFASTALADGYVYVHTPRLSEPVVVNGQTIVPEASAWQSAMDVSRPFGPYPEMNVRMEIGGKTIMIEDCTGNPQQLCAVMDPRVSPNGQQIVYRKSVLQPQCVKAVIGYTGVTIPDYCDHHIKTSELWLYDIPTKSKRRLTTGFNDITPNWATDTMLVFSSNRGEDCYPNRGYGPQFHRYYFHDCMRIFRMEIGEKPVMLTPGEQVAISPEVMSWGEVCYSSWDGWGRRGKNLSPRNLWWITCVSINGGGVHVRLGAHMSPPIHALKFITDWYGGGGMQNESLFALRPPAELWLGWFGVGNYYRENPSGFGSGLICPYQQAEGALTAAGQPWSVSQDTRKGSGQYVPSGCFNPVPFASGQDTSPKRHKVTGHPAGRAAYFTADSKGEYLFSYCIGECYKPMNNHLRAFTWKELTGVVAQKTLRRALVKQVTDPWDEKQSIQVACFDEDRPHCWDGREISTYKERFGIAAPKIGKVIDPYEGECRMNIVDARATEGYKHTTLQQHADCQIQGCVDPDYSEKVKGFMLLGVEMHKTPPPAKGPGSPYGISGDFAARPHYSTTTITTKDGSMSVPVPCMKPFQHGGVGALGGILAFAFKPIWASPDKPLTCHGCHDGMSETRVKELGNKTPEQRFLTTEAGPGC